MLADRNIIQVLLTDKLTVISEGVFNSGANFSHHYRKHLRISSGYFELYMSLCLPLSSAFIWPLLGVESINFSWFSTRSTFLMRSSLGLLTMFTLSQTILLKSEQQSATMELTNAQHVKRYERMYSGD